MPNSSSKHLSDYVGAVWLILMFGIWGLALPKATAQAPTAKPNTADSIAAMSSAQFFKLVAERHPVAKQTRLLSEQAKAEIRLARGAFDPKLNFDMSRKTLGNKLFYNNSNGYLSIPTWVGADFKVGHERGIGSAVSNEGRTISQGLGFAGVTLPIGQGLFIDQRRAALKQALLLPSLNEAERVKQINKLLFTAIKDYFDWYFSYQEFQLADLGMRLAKERYEAVVMRAIVGENAGIDTVEAKILYQDRMIAREQAKVNLTNNRLLISTYLWDESGNPLEASEKLVPENPFRPAMSAKQVDSLRQFALTNHPDLRKIAIKQQLLTIDRRLAREMLKPTLDLSYNLIDYMPAQANQYDWNFLQNNYKIGTYFAFPIFLRKERGKLRLTELKLEQNDLERANINRLIGLEIDQSYNTLTTLQGLLTQQESMVQNYQKLRDAELDKFFVGESSLFLINTRESKLLESQVKLADLQRKVQKAQAELSYAAGMPNFWE